MYSSCLHRKCHGIMVPPWSEVSDFARRLFLIQDVGVLQEQMIVYGVSLEKGMQLAAKLELLWVSVVDFSEEIRGVEVRNSFYSALPALDDGFDVFPFYFINDIQQKRELIELWEAF